MNPILDTRISVCPSVWTLSFSVTLRLPPLDSETGWTGELWSNTNLLIQQNIFFSIKKFLPPKIIDLKKGYFFLDFLQIFAIFIFRILLDWRALVKSCIPNIGKQRNFYKKKNKFPKKNSLKISDFFFIINIFGIILYHYLK